MDRRTVLGVLGLTSAGAVALDGTAIANQDVMSDKVDGLPGMALRSPETQERYAQALEALAKNIRSRKVACVSLKTSCNVNFDEWVQHEVTFKLEIEP
jgi:hypothetical protein